MKKLIIAALLSAPIAVSALPAPKPDFCASLSGYAGKVMKARQIGRLMSDVIGSIPAEGGAIMTSIVIDAYSESRFSTENYQRKSIVNFENKWFLSCVKSTQKAKNEP